MMALRQPMGIDLRLLTSALKSAVILERMGDLAKNTVKRSTHFTAPLDAETAAKLQQMLQIITSMLTETMQAFASHDEKKVFTVYGKDSEVDAIYYDLISTLEEQMRHNSAQVSSYMQVIFAVKNIERFGDYVTKLARMVYYIVSGVRPPKG